MLPMLPLYVSYFAAGTGKKHHIFARALAFVLGFTVVFTALGLFAGTIGTFLSRYSTVVNIICGIAVILFGLSYLEIIRLPFLKGMKSGREITGVFSAMIFGAIYSVSLTPCVAAFLGSALMLASTAGSALEGMLLLLVYSIGLGVPFILSAVLIDSLGSTFNFIKKHYKVINTVCGIFLIIMGLLMAFGLMGRVQLLFS